MLTEPFIYLDHPIHPPKSTSNHWDCDFPLADEDSSLKLVSGVYQVLGPDGRPRDYEYPDLDAFVSDMQLMCALIADGPLKSFCFR